MIYNNSFKMLENNESGLLLLRNGLIQSFFVVLQKSYILTLFGRVQVIENPHSGIFYAVFTMILLARKNYISYYNSCNFSLLEIELHLTIFNVSEFFLLLQEIGITASADNTVRVWSIPNSSCAYVIKVSIDQLIFTCSKSTMRALEKSVKYVQS